MEILLPDGIVKAAKQINSPNFNERPESTAIDLIVIHNISLPPGQFGDKYVTDFFCNNLNPDIHPYFATIAASKVSSHILIKRDGNMIQYVPFKLRAWHAGMSEFKGRFNCNDFSIGIELEGADDIAYTEEQYQALSQLTIALRKAYPAITAENIVGHQHIAPDRKTDPGKSFKWEKYFELADIPK